MSWMDRVRGWWMERRASSFHVSQTPPAYVSKWGGMETASGVDVNETTALYSTAVWACVKILAESVAGLPLILYRRTENGKERAVEHPLYRLLHDAPNEEMTSFEWRETLQGHLATWGNGFSEIERNRGGRVVGLWPWRPDRVSMQRMEGNLVYGYRESATAEERYYPAEKVLHIRGLGSNGLWGYGPIAMERQAIGLAMATEEFGSRFFGNGARPGGVLEHPGKLSKEAFDRLKESWQATHEGLENSGKVAILEEGLKYQALGIPPEDAQFLETRRFQIAEIARIFRIPPHMLADLEKATFSNIEHQSIEFVTHTMRPWLVRWEQRLNQRLLSPSEQATYYFEFLVDGLLRGDIQSRYQAYAIGKQWGWLSTNDVRMAENMNLVEGGDEYLVPMNMVPMGESDGNTKDTKEAQGSQSEDNSEEDDDGEGSRDSSTHKERASQNDMMEEGRSTAAKQGRWVRERMRLAKAQRGVFEDVIGRIVRREAQDVSAGMRKHLGSRSADTFDLWLDEFYYEHERWIYKQMDPAALAYGENVNAAGWNEAQALTGSEEGAQDLTPNQVRFVRSLVAAYASEHCYQNREAIRKIVKEALADGNRDPAAEVEAELERMKESQPASEAREEANRQGNAVSQTAYLLAGLRRNVWVQTGDSCPYCKRLDGVTLDIMKAFLDVGEFGGGEGVAPLMVRRLKKHPPAHGGCDCLVMGSL